MEQEYACYLMLNRLNDASADIAKPDLNKPRPTMNYISHFAYLIVSRYMHDDAFDDLRRSLNQKAPLTPTKFIMLSS